MARDFSEMGANAANLIAILGGGACYCFCVIRPNAADSWNPQAFGTLAAYSLAGYDVLTNRLISVGDIDNAIDPYRGPLAFCPDVQVQIQNVLADIDFSIYQGRVLEIRLGYGASMTVATSTIMFTGRIVDSKVELHKITFTARGKSQLADKPVGVPLPDDVDDKYKGKIYPMTWGDWTDENAYAPVVLNRAAEKNPDVVFDTEPLHTYDSLRVYDESAKTDYRAKTTGSVGVFINADKNIISAVRDLSITLTAGIGENDIIVKLNNTAISAEYSEAFDADPTILKIGDELLYVCDVGYPGAGGSVCAVYRGYNGTTKAVHAAATPVYVCAGDFASVGILVENVFWAKAMSGLRIENAAYWDGPRAFLGSHVSTNGVWIFPCTLQSGILENIFDKVHGGAGAATYAEWYAWTNDQNNPNGQEGQYSLSQSRINVLFGEIGISAEVENAYLIAEMSMNTQHTAADKIFYSLISEQENLEGQSCTSNGSTFQVLYSKWYFGTHLYMKRTAGITEPATELVFPGGTYAILFEHLENVNSYIALVNATDTKKIIDSTAESGDGAVAATFNNVNGVDTELDLPLTGAIKPADVSDLAGYALEWKLYGAVSSVAAWIQATLHIYAIGIRCDFYVSPLEYDFYVRLKGRKNPGGYFNGDAGDLMENPSSVIEDFCKTADAGSAIISLTEAGFDEAYSARAIWKLAHTVYAKEDDRPKFREELEKMLECSGLVCFEKYDGTFSIATLDAPVAVTRNIAASEVKVDGQKRAQIKYSYLPAEMLITSIEVKYAPILPEDGKYAGRIYTSRTEATDSDSECMGYMQQAYEALGEERPLIVEAPAIRDATTAAALAKLIIKLRYKSLVKVEINGTYKLLNIELLDKIGLSGLGFLPVAIEGKTFIVTGHRIQPHVNGEEPDVRIVLTELGTATIEEALVWIEEGAGAAEKIEVGSAAVNKFYEVGTL